MRVSALLFILTRIHTHSYIPLDTNNANHREKTELLLSYPRAFRPRAWFGFCRHGHLLDMLDAAGRTDYLKV
jgi:hypothetical protein